MLPRNGIAALDVKIGNASHRWPDPILDNAATVLQRDDVNGFPGAYSFVGRQTEKEFQMCGIAGYVDWSTPILTEEVIDRMTRTLRPRGPDASSTWTGRHAALGHARLAVIDPEGGAQPMIAYSGDAPVVLTYGGEIYNHPELRRQLEHIGHRFTTRSDSEVVLRSYLQWGPACVERFNGMFSFAVWNSAEESLLLARDRMGIKPLYYAQTPTGVVFGSELKALLEHPDVDRAIDADGLAELTALVPMTSPGCGVLRGVHELLPASTMRIDRYSKRTERYWELREQPHEDDLATTVARIRDLLNDSISVQVVADVPLCTLNSGGVDSAALTAIAARCLSGRGRELLTFDVDHAVESAGEIVHSGSGLHVERDHAYALLTAKHVVSRHETLTLTTDDLLGAHEATLRAMDLPSYSTLNASLGLLFRRVRADATVALSGEGADELFHGYRWYHDPDDYIAQDFPWHRVYRPIIGLMNRSAVDYAKPVEYRRRHYMNSVSSARRTGSDRRVNEAANLTNDYYLQFLLRRADRLSMATGVEVRVPYLDHRLVEYVWNIPPAMKGVGGIEKAVLRRAVADYLPEEVAWRRKSGYPASLTRQYQQALWRQARDVVSDRTSPVHSVIDAAAVTALLDTHEQDLTDWTPTQHISYVLELDSWLTQYRISVH